MIKIITISLSAILLFSVSCKTQDKNKTIPVKKIIIDQSFRNPNTELDYKIVDFNIEGSLLTTKISFKGDCGIHNFDLIFNKAFLKSMPPQAVLYLKHEASGKICNKEITKELKFDISELMYPMGNEVHIKLHSFSEKKTYKY